MPTQCSPHPLGFAPVEGRAVVAAFDGGAVTSDAGALLLGATDRAIRLIERFAACFSDGRAQGRVAGAKKVGKRDENNQPEDFRLTPPAGARTTGIWILNWHSHPAFIHEKA